MAAETALEEQYYDLAILYSMFGILGALGTKNCFENASQISMARNAARSMTNTDIGNACRAGSAGRSGGKSLQETDILSDKPLTNQTAKVDNYVSGVKGDAAASADFYAMNPTNVRTYPNGTIVGDLLDGRTINIHPSTTLNGVPSVEIYNPVTNKSIKIRY